MARIKTPPVVGSALEAATVAAMVGGLAYAAARGARRPKPDAEATETGPGFAVGRGRRARHPGQIPMRGWKDILLRTLSEFNDDHITIIAAGVTFSILLAIFPALGAFVALYGLVADVSRIPDQLQTLSVVLPADAVKFIGGEMTRLALARHGGLSLALVTGLLISFWSANGAMKAIFVGMNVAYEEKEKRGLVRLNLISLVFTLGLLAFLMAVTAALGLGAVAAKFLGPQMGALISVARWPLLLLGFGGSVAMLYRYGPSRARARWRWISWGSGVATLLWLAASLLFSLYVSNFAHYDRTYGSLGTVIGLMVWIWISTIIILFGAELNGEIEHQTGVDTTTGASAPMGTRGAKMADSLGKPARAK